VLMDVDGVLSPSSPAADRRAASAIRAESAPLFAERGVSHLNQRPGPPCWTSRGRPARAWPRAPPGKRTRPPRARAAAAEAYRDAAAEAARQGRHPDRHR